MAGVDDDVIAWRRYLHRNPELGTAAFVPESLEGSAPRPHERTRYA